MSIDGERRGRVGRHPARLTPRELQVLELLAEGLVTREIAERLKASEHSIKRAASYILAKLNASNRTMAVARALGDGLIEAPVTSARHPDR